MALKKKVLSDFEVRRDHPTLQQWRMDIHNFIVDCIEHIKSSKPGLSGEWTVLEVSGDGFAKHIDNCKFETTEIRQEENPTYLCAVEDMKIIKSNSYDLVICTEVLEHCKKPWLGADEIYRVTKPGGYILITVPCNLGIHGCISNNSILGTERNELFDYWRYICPRSIELLFSERITKVLPCISGNHSFPNGVGLLAQKPS